MLEWILLEKLNFSFSPAVFNSLELCPCLVKKAAAHVIVVFNLTSKKPIINEFLILLK